MMLLDVIGFDAHLISYMRRFGTMYSL